MRWKVLHNLSGPPLRSIQQSDPERRRVYPSQPYLVSAIHRWGGRDGCAWDGLRTLRTSHPFFAVNLTRWNGCAVHLYTLHPLLIQRRGLGLCRWQVGMRGRTWRASRVVGVFVTRPLTGEVGNATLPTSEYHLAGGNERELTGRCYLFLSNAPQSRAIQIRMSGKRS